MGSKFFRPVAITATACSAVQAFLWMVLGLLGLLTAVEVMGPAKLEDVWEMPSQNGEWKLPTPVQTFQLSIIGCYFPRYETEMCCVDDLILRGDPMMAISIVYIVVSFIWLCISTMFLQDMLNKGEKLVVYALVWAGITGAIALLDFVVAILLGVDYSKMINEGKCYGGIFQTVPGFLMSLTARGYVLWVLNVAAAIFLGRSAAKGELTPKRQWSRSSTSSVYNSPADALQDSRSRSMVYQNTERPWVPGGGSRNPQQQQQQQQPRQPFPQQQQQQQQMYPPLNAWERPDSAESSIPRPRASEAPGPAYYPEVQRGGLAARMSQAPGSNYGSQRAPSPQQPQGPRRHIPEPDYDAGKAQPRSALKKTPSPAPPPPPGDYRQQNNNGWQPPHTPMSPNGRGGWQPSASSDNRSLQGYDNRGYNDNNNSNWQGDGRSSTGRHGRTGF